MQFFAYITIMAKTLVLTEAGLNELQKGALSKIEAQILWHLVATLPLVGRVVPHESLVDLLFISARSAQHSMSQLTESGFLIRGPKMGLSYHYKINPVFFRIIS